MDRRHVEASQTQGYRTRACELTALRLIKPSHCQVRQVYRVPLRNTAVSPVYESAILCRKSEDLENVQETLYEKAVEYN